MKTLLKLCKSHIYDKICECNQLHKFIKKQKTKTINKNEIHDLYFTRRKKK